MASTSVNTSNGLAEIKEARKGHRTAFVLVGLFSIFANLLMLTSPIYMMQVYDRVLGSESLDTLLALTFLAGFLFLVMGILDYVRGRILGRVGARFHDRLQLRVFNAVQDKTASGFGDPYSQAGLKDLDSMQKALSSQPYLTFLGRLCFWDLLRCSTRCSACWPSSAEAFWSF